MRWTEEIGRSLALASARRRAKRVGADHTPRDHRCDVERLEDDEANMMRWHPDGVSDEYEEAWTVLVCPVCGQVRVRCIAFPEVMWCWERRPALRGKLTPPPPPELGVERISGA